MEHVTCLVDVLSRRGRVVEAEEIVKKFNTEVMWRTLLGGIRMHVCSLCSTLLGLASDYNKFRL